MRRQEFPSFDDVSRRRKRRNSGKNESKQKPTKVPIFVKIGVFLVLGVILLLIIGYASVRMHLQGEKFRNQTAESVGKLLGGKGEIKSHSWDGWDLSSSGFNFTEGKGTLKSLSAREIQLGVDIGSITSDAWDISHVDILEMTMNYASADPDYVPYVAEEPTGLASLLPHKTNLETFEVKDTSVNLYLQQKDYKFSNIRAKGEVIGAEEYTLDLSGGMIHLPFEELQDITHIDSTLKIEGEDLYLSDARVKIFGDNAALVDAKYIGEQDRFDLDIDTKGIDIEPFILSDWQRSVSGKATLKAKFSTGGKLVGEKYSGFMQVDDAVVKSVPVLDKVAAYTKNVTYRELRLSKCQCNFVIYNGVTELTNLDIEERDKLSILGKIKVGDDDSLDGKLRVGLPKGVLSLIPGAETKVFLPGERGLLWANVAIGGTLDNITEDLSKQLIDAAAERMFEMIPETGEKVLSFLTGNSNGENLQGALGSLTTGKDLLSGVMNGVLGSGADITGELLGSRKTLKGEDWWTEKFGWQFSLTNRWAEAKSPAGSNKGIVAKWAKPAESTAELMVATAEAEMRPMIESMKKRASENTSDIAQFLTREEFAALLFTEKENGGDSARVYCGVQVNEATTFLFLIDCKVKELDVMKANLQEIAETVRKPKKEQGGLLDSVLPKAGGLIPNLIP